MGNVSEMIMKVEKTETHLSLKRAVAYLLQHASFLEKRNFLKILLNIDIEKVQNPHVKAVLAYLKEYYNTYRVLPSKHNVFSKFEWDETLEADPLDFKNFIDYIKASYINNFFLKFLDYKDKGDLSILREVYKTIRFIEDTNVSFVEDLDLSSIEFDDLNYKEERIPTPWADINKNMAGGLGRGELGMVALPSGWGKSWFLVSIGLHAFRLKKKVIYFTLELDSKYVMRRFIKMYAKYTQHPNDYKKVFESMKRAAQAMNNYLKVVFCSTLEDIEHYVAAYNPDVILVDYADLIYDVQETNEKQYLMLQKIYRKLRNMAKVNNAAVWTASQFNRGSLGKEAEIDYIEKYIADSFGKVFEIDFGMGFVPSASSSTPDIHSGYGKIIKNRMGSVRNLIYTINFENFSVDVALR